MEEESPVIWLVFSALWYIAHPGLRAGSLYTIIAIILFHLYITQIEERYLERIFGKKHLLYKESWLSIC